VTGNTEKYLTKGSKILEGGCGIGKNVYLLRHYNYEVIGIDYAHETVSTVNSLFPDLDVRFGDVRNLNFPDKYFDGYWSFGVIEHFYNGYDSIMSEMYRVLKKDGYLFMTVPTLSPIRRYKARNSYYKNWKGSASGKENFYQFILDPLLIIEDFEKIGFQLVRTSPYDGVKGLKDEIKFGSGLLQSLYDSQLIVFRILKKVISFTLQRFTSHMTLFIFKKI
jgi:SAM-dependent methyltransferase